MSDASPDRETEGIQRLQALLGADFRVERRSDPTPDNAGRPTNSQTTIAVTDVEQGGYATVVVVLRESLSPAEALGQLPPQLTLIRQLASHAEMVVISPWLSPRTRQVLADLGIGYLDYTGNVLVSLRRPRVLISKEGDTRNPSPQKSVHRGLSGPKAATLVRELVDFMPPHTAKDLHERTGLSLPYISRLLDALEDLALIRRDAREIVAVDWMALLRERASQMNLLKTNPYVEYLAPNGTSALLERLKADPGLVASTAVTGSYAARAITPLTIGGPLMLYVPADIHAPDNVAKALNIWRDTRTPDVFLLRASNDIVFKRTRETEGLRHVALSQLALDCLSGPGRLPDEAEAILDYMTDREQLWRKPKPPLTSNQKGS